MASSIVFGDNYYAQLSRRLIDYWQKPKRQDQRYDPRRLNPPRPIALRRAVAGEEARDLEYSAWQLWRVAYDGSLVTRRMRRRLDRTEKRRRAKASPKNP